MSLTFANPHAFWLLLLLPVCVLLKVFGDLRARRATGRLASPRLVDSLVVSEGRARGWVVLSLEMLALVFFTASLARPQYGVTREETPGIGRSLIIAMDTSKSMDATDLLPSRLARAQLAAEELVKRLRGYRVGLMPFAGTALMYAPITPDVDAVLDCIQDLDTDFIPRAGSNISRAIDLGIATFKRADLSGQQAMVIFSDGEELEGEAVAAAKRAREANLAVICVGVGTAAGGPIEDAKSDGGLYRDRTTNKIVMTRLEKESLVKIADLTGGLYVSLDAHGVSDARIDTILAKLQRSEMKTKVTETAVDRYRWPLVAGLLSLTAAFLTGIVRRYRGALPAAVPVATALCALLFSVPQQSAAQDELLPPPAAEENVAPQKEARVSPKEKEKEAPPEREPAPVKGDPWQFYNLGDWRNSVFNFDREIEAATVLKRSDKELDRLYMARGAAAFKGAIAKADQGKFDNHMIEQAIDAFGSALASNDKTILENAHYNLANAVFERTKAADKLREENLKKAVEKKSKKGMKKFAVTLPYLDRTIRQLENCVEHYQETLILNEDHARAKANHERVAELIKKLRDIRKQKAEEGQGKGKGKGEGKGEGEGEGEGEGQGKGKGKGKGQGKGQGSGSGEEEGEGEGGGEEADEGDGGDEGDADGSGKGENGEKPGDGSGKGDKEGKGEGEGDETNKEFDGKAGTEGDTGSGDEGAGEGEGEGDSDNPEGDNGGGANPGSGGGSDELARKLRNLSQEIKDRLRPKGENRERRPLKDW